MKDRNEALRAIPLFRDLPEKDLADIAGLLIDRKFPRDAVVYEDGSLGDYMYIISEGQVKITKMSEDGREKNLEILGPELPRRDGDSPARSANHHAPRRRLPGDFWGLEAEPRVTLELIHVLARRCAETDGGKRLRGRAAPGARWRGWPRPVAGGRTVATSPITHQQLADVVGKPRDHHPRGEGAEGRGLARAGGQALPRPERGRRRLKPQARTHIEPTR
jgi:CRP/FNR family transcriptional regulator